MQGKFPNFPVLNLKPQMEFLYKTWKIMEVNEDMFVYLDVDLYLLENSTQNARGQKPEVKEPISWKDCYIAKEGKE